MPNRTHFPLVGDDEPVVTPPIQMALYDDKDLISNIRGDYQEPDFANVDSGTKAESGLGRAVDVQSRPGSSHQAPVIKERISESDWQYQLPQRRARQDNLKYKQAAGYFTPSKPSMNSKGLVKNSLAKPVTEQDKPSRLAAAADRLHQTSYILADLKPAYQVPDNSGSKAKKNSYDFLRQSQVYNYEENRKKKEKKVAQELNLTRFEQREKL